MCSSSKLILLYICNVFEQKLNLLNSAYKKNYINQYEFLCFVRIYIKPFHADDCIKVFPRKHILQKKNTNYSPRLKFWRLILLVIHIESSHFAQIHEVMVLKDHVCKRNIWNIRLNLCKTLAMVLHKYPKYFLDFRSYFV